MIEFISPIQTYYATTLLAQHEAEDSPIRRETVTLYFHARTPSMAEIETLVREHYSKKEDVFREILGISKHTTPPGQPGTLGVEDGVTEGFTHTFVVQTVAVSIFSYVNDPSYYPNADAVVPYAIDHRDGCPHGGKGWPDTNHTELTPECEGHDCRIGYRVEMYRGLVSFRFFGRRVGRGGYTSVFG